MAGKQEYRQYGQKRTASAAMKPVKSYENMPVKAADNSASAFHGGTSLTISQLKTALKHSNNQGVSLKDLRTGEVFHVRYWGELRSKTPPELILQGRRYPTTFLPGDNDDHHGKDFLIKNLTLHD